MSAPANTSTLYVDKMVTVKAASQVGIGCASMLVVSRVLVLLQGYIET